MKINVNPNAKALIFDLDGTLADTMPIHFAAWKELLTKRGLVYNQELFNKLAGIPTNSIVAVLNKYYNTNMNTAEVVGEKQKLFLKNLDKIKPIFPVIDIVKEYYNRLPMAVGTGNYKEFAALILKLLNLEKYFKVVVAADNVQNHKPSPDTFLECAKLMNVQPEFCQVFEDADNGVEAAKQAGMMVTDLRKYSLNA